MPDICDLAAEREQLDTERAIAAARRTTCPLPTACGYCHNCEASVPDGALWCDADCRDDWQARLKQGAAR